MLILTSRLDCYTKDENENRIVHNFGNKNGIYDIISNSVKKFDSLLLISGSEDDYENTDKFANLIFQSFDLTLPFKNYTILDGRNKADTRILVENADLIILTGGHVPTQIKFFNNIDLKNIIKNTNVVILGISAGSMNCANVVYAPPEIDGEEIDESYQRFFGGLCLTNINIIPHHDVEQYSVVGEKRYLEDIVIPDSYIADFIAINNDSFVTVENGKNVVYGEAYKISKGEIIKICEDEQNVRYEK